MAEKILALIDRYRTLRDKRKTTTADLHAAAADTLDEIIELLDRVKLHAVIKKMKGEL